MPPKNPLPTGTALLQQILTYLEVHFAPGGVHPACGANLDIAISVEAPVAPTHASFDPLKQVFVVECLKCRERFEVTMEALVDWDGTVNPPPPDVPESEWPACTICHAPYPPPRVRRGAPAAVQLGVCDACSSVSKDIGQIVSISEEERLV
jgi:hypothetical protein